MGAGSGNGETTRLESPRCRDIRNGRRPATPPRRWRASSASKSARRSSRSARRRSTRSGWHRCRVAPGSSAGPGSLRARQLFTTHRAELAAALAAWRTGLDDAGYLWISWPKRASRVPTDVSEDAIRELALPLGFVDVKVCAVSEVWSGLKLVVRKELRRR